MTSLRRWSALRAQLLYLPILVMGCGGGGGGGGTALGQNSAGAPAATITFPPAGALTDASVVTVTGTASDVDGVFSASVNGVACTSGDGFATWQAQVPVVVGANTMTVQTVDGIGNTQTNAASVSVTGTTVMAFDPASVVVDAANNRSLVAFLAPPSVLAVDLTTGDRSLISRADRGTGSNLEFPIGLELDSAGGRAFIADVLVQGVSSSVIAVDLATGNRTDLSSSGVGAGGNLLFAFGITQDAGTNRVLVGEIAPAVVVAVDIATGDRSTLFTAAGGNIVTGLDIDTVNGQLLVTVGGSDDALRGVDLGTGAATAIADSVTGAGPALGAPRSVCLDVTTTPARALVVDTVADGVLTVDLASGNRTVLADASTGSGTALTDPEDIEVDVANNRALVTLDSIEDQVVAVDLATGDRSALTQMPGVGTGTAFDDPNSLVLDSANARVLVLDRQLDAVVAVAIPGGNRTIISDAGTGSGTALDEPRDLTLDSANGRVLVTDIGSTAADDGLVVAVDLATGNRTEFSGPGRGIGPPDDFDRPEGVVLDSTNGRLLVVDSGLDAVVAVDLATGNRSVIADDATGTGTNLDIPSDLVLDLAGNRVLLVDEGNGVKGVLAVDLTSGNRTVISDGATGTGGAFDTPTDLVLDSAGNRVLVVDSGTKQVIAVDLSTGNRAELSGAAVGAGPLSAELEGVVRDAASGTLFLVDRDIAVVLAVEEDSGDRVMISR